MPIMKQTKATMVARFTALAFMASFIQAVGAFLSRVRNSFQNKAALLLAAVSAVCAGAAVAAPATLSVPLFGDLIYDDVTFVIASLDTSAATGGIFAIWAAVFTLVLLMVVLRKISVGGKKT